MATDLHARREVWFQRGPLAAAIRASIAIPGVITPVEMNGRLLADGGLMNPVPIEPMAAAAADLTVAISLQGARTSQRALLPRPRGRRPQPGATPSSSGYAVPSAAPPTPSPSRPP